MAWLDVVHPEDRDVVGRAWKAAMASGTKYDVEYRVRAREGGWRHVHATGVPIRRSDGVVREWIGTLNDVTEQRQAATAEQDLARVTAESERQRRMFETALSNTPDFTYLFDLEGRFTYINKALLDLWQKDLSQAVGKNFFDLDYPPDLAARLQSQIQEVIRTRQPIRDETPYTSAAGTRAYEYIFVPVLGGTGEVEAVAGSTRDITERTRAGAALRENERALPGTRDRYIGRGVPHEPGLVGDAPARRAWLGCQQRRPDPRLDASQPALFRAQPSSGGDRPGRRQQADFRVGAPSHPR